MVSVGLTLPARAGAHHPQADCTFRRDAAHVVAADVAEIIPLSRPAYVKGRGEYQGSFIRGGDGDREPVDDASAEISALFARQPELSAADVAQAIGLGRAMVRRYLARLVETRPGTHRAPRRRAATGGARTGSVSKSW